MLAVGDTVDDKYEVEAVLGSGGTAVVYRVKHESLGTRHALKVLSVTSDTIRDRMLIEGRVQATMNHPNVVAVTDVIQIDEAPGLLMEYVQGPGLDKAIRKYRISRAAAETLFVGIVAGVKEAHAHGLVHRDLKPANVLLDRTSEGFIPKVTDFGLAKVLADSQGSGMQTRAGIALGTPAYMAPEQVRDARTVDQRADIFALGCLLYELMVRRRVFPGEDTIDIYNQVLDGRYIPPKAYVPSLPPRIDLAIRGALIIDKNLRIPDTETLLAVLAGERGWDIPEMVDLAPDDLVLTPQISQQHNAPDLPLSPTLSRSGLSVAESIADPPRTQDPLWASITGSEADMPSIGDHTAERTGERTGEVAGASAGSWVMLATAGLLFVVALAFAIVGTGVALFVEPPERVTTVNEQPQPVQSVPIAPATDDGSPGDTEQPVVAGTVDPDPVPDPTPAPPVATPTPRPQPVVTPPTPVVASTVEVKILTQPPTATLVVDGVDQGRTPRKLSLSPGRHVVQVTSGAGSATFDIDVGRAGGNKWCHSFTTGESVAGACP